MIIKRYKTNAMVGPQHNEYIHCNHNVLKENISLQDPLEVFTNQKARFCLHISQYDHFYADQLHVQCFALSLARLLMHIIDSGDYVFQKKGYFSKDFYCNCIEKAKQSEIREYGDDDDLLEIYLKQMINILVSAGVIVSSKNQAVLSERYESDIELYSVLFRTFWHDIEWENIFPSDPPAAEKLKKQKGILKQLILKIHRPVPIDYLSNEFFNLTGFTERNDIFMISFLDFYFFTWLMHFGIIRYICNTPDKPVCIGLTKNGIKILHLFS